MKKVVFLGLIILLLTSGCSVKKVEEVTDEEKFAAEYGVSKNNPYEYSDIDEILDILENGTGIVLFANPDCVWCPPTIEVLTEALKYKNVEKVYYYDPKKIRDNNTKKYKKLVKLLDEYLLKNEEDEAYLYLPDVYFVKDGEIIGHNNDMATQEGEPTEYFTKENKKELKNKYIELISEYNALECTTC